MRSRDGVLVIQTLLWPDEVRAAEFSSLDGVDKPKAKELAMAETLVDSMADDFDPTEFTDDYQVQLRELLDEMIESGGKKVIPPVAEVEKSGEDAEVVDLVAALQRSVDAAGKKAAPAKKKPAKKAPAKTAAKKATAKSSSSERKRA